MTTEERVAELERRVAIITETACAYPNTKVEEAVRSVRRGEVGKLSMSLFDEGFTMTGRWPFEEAP